jgi:hypothetical protein
MGGKHPGIEMSRDLVGMRRNDRRRRPDYVEILGRQQGWVRSIGGAGHGFSLRCSERHPACRRSSFDGMTVAPNARQSYRS